METITECACGRTFTQQESSGSTCFKCKVSNIHFGFRGVSGPGRKKFHEETIKSYVEQSDRNIRAQGLNPKKDFEFTGKRWV